MGKKLVNSEELSEYADDIMDTASALSPVGAVIGAMSPSSDEDEDENEQQGDVMDTLSAVSPVGGILNAMMPDEDDEEDRHASYMAKYAEDFQQTDKMQQDYEQRNAKAVEDMSTPKAMKRFM